MNSKEFSTLYVKDIESIISNKQNFKEVYVLYSGGCDSTLVLHKALRTGNRIHTISFTSDQLGGSNNEDKKRKEYFEYCKKNELLIGENLLINIDNDGSRGFKTGEFSCAQPGIWLYNMIAYLPDNSIVLTGYIRGDDFLTYDVFSSWLQAYEGLKGLFGKNIEIYFPFMYKNKTNIIEELKEYDIEKYTTYCETPKVDGTACGECESCEKHIAYNHLLNRRKIIERKKSKLSLSLGSKIVSGFETHFTSMPDIPKIQKHTKLKTTKKKINKIKHGNI